MEEKFFEYGTEHPVEVIRAHKTMVTVRATDINEGFILLGHGLNPLPNIGDEGKIVFEKGGPKRGYWQYYPNKITLTHG